MGKFLVALTGVVVGFVLAHLANQTAEGTMFFRRTRATLASFVRGFRSAWDGDPTPRG